MPIKHSFVSDRTDSDDGQLVQPSGWNAEHEADGLIGALINLGARANAFPYLDGDQVGQLTDLSALMRGVLALATSVEVRAALGAAAISSPAFQDVPTAPTAPYGTISQQIANMAALQAMRDGLVNAAPGVLDTLKELADALGDDPNFAATMTATLAGKQPLATLLTNFVALATAADKAVYFTAANTPALMAFTAFARTLAACVDATAGRTALGLGSAATLTAGTAANDAVQLDAAGKLPAVDGSTLTAVVAAWAAITGKPAFGTAATLNVGTAASQIVQMTAAAKLPAVDGSLLTNVNAALPPAPTFTGLITAAGGQISFPATQNPSAGANVLDDYEEGTFTPLGYGQTFASAAGSYTKIGRLVSVSMALGWSNNGAGNPAMVLGLPFQSAAQSSLACGIINVGAMRTFYIAAGGNGVSVYDVNANTVTDASMSNATIYLAGSYAAS